MQFYLYFYRKQSQKMVLYIGAANVRYIHKNKKTVFCP